MSGGSYDYLCFASDLDELLAKRHALKEMVDRLAGLDEREFPGASAAADQSRALLVRLQMWSSHVDTMTRMLQPTWKAVEWWDSCDSGEDDVREALAAYRGEPGQPEVDPIP